MARGPAAPNSSCGRARLPRASACVAAAHVEVGADAGRATVASAHV